MSIRSAACSIEVDDGGISFDEEDTIEIYNDTEECGKHVEIICNRKV